MAELTDMARRIDEIDVDLVKRLRECVACARVELSELLPRHDEAVLELVTMERRIHALGNVIETLSIQCGDEPGDVPAVKPVLKNAVEWEARRKLRERKRQAAAEKSA